MRRTAGRRFAFLFLLLATLVVAGCAARFGGGRQTIDARVVEARGARVYVAADSGALVPGAHVAFANGGRTLGTGSVTALLDGTLASVLLDSGDLTGVRALKKLHVLVDPVAPSHPAAVRVGIPASARRSRVVSCAACPLALPSDWRVEPVTATTWRAIRDAAADTLLVRSYRDADDEEIAWERHDLDVAVFWSDELSASQRARVGSNSLLTGMYAIETGAIPCPILANPAGRAAVERLGAKAFADLPACIR